MHSSFVWDRQVGPALLQQYLTDIPSTSRQKSHQLSRLGVTCPGSIPHENYNPAQILRAIITINFLSFLKKKEFVNKLYSWKCK